MTGFIARISEDRAYKCCGSLFMVNLHSNPSPEVPVYMSQVMEYVTFFPSAPDLDEMPEITISAPPKKFDLAKMWGVTSTNIAV